jgi:hypothetical protein
MPTPRNKLEEITKLLDLESEGIRVEVKIGGWDSMRKIAEYSHFSRIISVLEDITPYWFALLATILHEFGHHTQKKILTGIASFILSIGVFASWISREFISLQYGFFYFLLLLGILAIAINGIRSFLEIDANDCMANQLKHTPILLLLARVEELEIAQVLEMDRDAIQGRYTALKSVLKEYFGEFLI